MSIFTQWIPEQELKNRVTLPTKRTRLITWCKKMKELLDTLTINLAPRSLRVTDLRWPLTIEPLIRVLQIEVPNCLTWLTEISLNLITTKEERIRCHTKIWTIDSMFPSTPRIEIETVTTNTFRLPAITMKDQILSTRITNHISHLWINRLIILITTLKRTRISTEATLNRISPALRPLKHLCLRIIRMTWGSPQLEENPEAIMLIEDLLPKDQVVAMLAKGHLQVKLFAQARRNTRRILNMIDPIKVTKQTTLYPEDQKDSRLGDTKRLLMAIPNTSLLAVILAVNWAMALSQKSTTVESSFACPSHCLLIFLLDRFLVVLSIPWFSLKKESFSQLVLMSLANSVWMIKVLNSPQRLY